MSQSSNAARANQYGSVVPDSFTSDLLDQNWHDVQRGLAQTLGPSHVKNWISRLSPRRLSDGVLELASPDAFILDHVMANFASDIRESWISQCPEVKDVQLVVQPHAKSGEVVPLRTVSEFPAAPTLLGEPPQPNPRFVFENFVVGRENKLAHSVCKSVAAAAPLYFTPVYVQGTTGMGKTHLLHAILHAYLERVGNLHRVAFLPSGDVFAQIFVRALQSNRGVEFKEQIRNLDLLVIDDISSLPNKETFQHELLQTVTRLIDSGRGVVVAGHNPPNQLNHLDDRLRDRLTSGVVAEIRPPAPDLRHAMVTSFVSRLQQRCPALVWPPALSRHLAQRIASSPRNLEGAINRLEAEGSLVGEPLTIELANDRLNDLIESSAQQITPEMILEHVASHHNVRVEQLKSRSRRAQLVRPRQTAMYLMRKLTDSPLQSIGQYFGRDHSTVMYAVEKVADSRAQNQDMDRDLAALERTLKRG